MEAIEAVFYTVDGGRVDVDVVCAEERLASARGVEIGEPTAIWICGDGRHEFRLAAGRIEEGSNSIGGFLRAHGRSEATIGEIRFIEGKQPFWSIIAVYELHGVGDVGGECHHGDMGGTGFVGGGAADVEAEANPVVCGADFVELVYVVAAVEDDAFQAGGGAAGGCCGTRGGD